MEAASLLSAGFFPSGRHSLKEADTEKRRQPRLAAAMCQQASPAGQSSTGLADLNANTKLSRCANTGPAPSHRSRSLSGP